MQPPEEVFIQHVLVILDSEQPTCRCHVYRLNDNLLISGVQTFNLQRAGCAKKSKFDGFKSTSSLRRPTARVVVDTVEYGRPPLVSSCDP